MQSEEHWREHVYRGNVPQLTVRAIVVGMLIGALMCLSNLYVFLKTGWSMGVTITAAILAFAAFRLMAAARLTKTPLSALENNALTTVSSGAGYMTGGGNMAAFGALVMITAVRPDTLPMVAWLGTIAALGVVTAIPIKRQLINKEALAFPTGTATAETIRVIHGGGAESAAEGTRQARGLGIAAVGAALLCWVRDGLAAIPGQLSLPFAVAGRAAVDWTLAVKMEVVLVGAGALMSFRTTWSMLLGSILTYAFLAPAMVDDGVISTVTYKAIAGWMVWPAASILVASGLTTFALDWRSVARSFTGLTRAFRKESAAVDDPMDTIECPGWWFPAGYVILGPIVIALMAWLFRIPLWACVIAVPLAIVMGFVASRVTGETDITPTKAFGPVTQLVYGGIAPGNLPGNIMAANVTAGIGLHAADLLTTLKTGWLLGGNPRAQFWAQLFGVAVGAIVVVPAFNLLIPDPQILGTETWPAPSCLVWAGVSEAFAKGLSALGPAARSGIVAGSLLGIALALSERFAPARLKPFVPSPSGLGIAMVIPGSNGIAMFLGGLVAEILRRRQPVLAGRYVVPVSSGLIAGESLMGVAVALWLAGVFR
jgi:OPT family oligopeptide transporter